MRIIVGLGNPGDRYANTRHNLGFVVVDALLQKLEPVRESFWEFEKKGNYEFKKAEHNGVPLLLVKPQTHMNLSGISVASVIEYYKYPIEDVIVIYDDLDLPLGKIRIRFGGAAGGHKGVESIIDKVGDDKFLRIRLGIGHPHHEDGEKKTMKSKLSVEDYVIAPFERDEESKVREMTHKAEKNVFEILEHGIDVYMSKYNKE